MKVQAHRFSFRSVGEDVSLDTESCQFKPHWALSQAYGPNFNTRLPVTFRWKTEDNTIISIGIMSLPLISGPELTVG